MFENLPKFNDFAEDTFLKGDKIKIEDILNKEIVITGFKEEQSKLEKGGVYNKIQIVDNIEEDVEPHYSIFFSTSKVLDKQIKQYKNKLPFRATIIKQNKYYTLV